MAITPVWITGFEYGLSAISSNGGGLVSVFSGSPTVQSAVKRTGSYAIEFENSFQEYIYTTIGTTSVVVGRVYFNFGSFPDTANFIVCSTTTGRVGFYFDPADNKLYPRSETTNGTPSSALSTSTWYRLDWRWTYSGGNAIIDWQIDGVAQTQFTQSNTSTNFLLVQLGYTTAGSSTLSPLYMDDVVVSVTSADYPIGPGGVEGLRPNADGTHNNATNIMEDSAGNDIDGSTYTAYSLLDEDPWTSTANADYVRQTANGTGNYCEIQFADTSQVNIQGVQALLQYSSAATQPNNGTTIIRSNTTETTLYSGDMSETSAQYKSVIVTPESAWTTAIVNALRCRFGYSSDAAPDPYWLAIMLEVAYEEASNKTILFGAATITASSGQADIIPGAKTISSSNGSITLSGPTIAISMGDTIATDSGLLSISAQTPVVIPTGTICWGHSTSVLENYTRTFANRWTGTGTITGTGDSEQVELDPGQYMESQIAETGQRRVALNQNKYASGDLVAIYYKTGSTIANCIADDWHFYFEPFVSGGFVQMRLAPIVLYDTFTDANDTDLRSHTIAPVNLISGAWTNTVKTQVIYDNRTKQFSEFGSSYLEIYPTDMTINFKGKVIDDAGSITIRWRYVDTTSYYAVRLDKWRFILLYRYLNGDYTIQSADETVTFGYDYQIQIALSGTSITCFCHGPTTTRKVAGTMNYYADESTMHLFISRYQQTIDNFMITRP